MGWPFVLADRSQQVSFMLLANQTLGAAQSLIVATVGVVRPIRPAGAGGIILVAEALNLAGGTSVDAYVQTSFDDGANFWDVANFHFTATGAGLFVISP